MDDLITTGLGLESAVSAVLTCVVVTDALKDDLPIVYVNEAFSKLTGYSCKEALGRNCRFLQGPLTDRDTVDKIRDAILAGISIHCEILNYRRSGEQFWNHLTIDPIYDAWGRITHFISFQRDGVRERATIARLMNAEEQLANVIQNVPGYVFRRVMHADTTLDYEFISRSIFRILGMRDDTDWSGDEIVNHMHPEDKPGFISSVIHSGLTLTPLRSEFRIVTPSGQEHWFRSDSTPRAAAGGDVVWEGLAVDITAEKASESKLSHLTHHDGLTGLANRLLFRMSVTEAICKANSATSTVALFYANLDEFQVLNDELGHMVGDMALQQVGQTLLAFAETRGGTVARLGGDEFALLIPATGYNDNLLAISEAIRLDLRRQITIAGQDIAIETCVGAVRYQDFNYSTSASADERSAELMKRADLALRRAKQEGPGSCCIYSAEIDDRFRNRMALRRSLQDGVTNEQFLLHYQPLVDLNTGEIVGAEALVRWNHPDLGMQRPDLFIPYAETSGLIVPLGAWIMKKAMRQAQIWRNAGLVPPRIAINISGVQLQRPGFIPTVQQTLAETGANPANFEFELTEGTLIGGATQMHAQLHILRKLGFGLVIDDFGTGHSTLKYLRDFPVTKIKIDQTFVRQLVIDSNDASIIRAIVALARSLKLQIVAEGIETIMQRNFLREEGCAVGQGYLLSIPLEAEDFAWLLDGNRRLLPVEADARPAGPARK